MATFEIEANGKTYEIEAPDQASAVKAFQSFSGGGQPQTPQEPRIPVISDFNDFSNAFRTGATEGMTFGFGDELQAGVEAPVRAIADLLQGKGFDLGRSYGQGLEDVRGVMKAQTEKNPGAALAGDLTGSLVSGGGLAKGGLTLMNGAKSLPSMLGRGALEGAGYGAVSGFGRSEGDLGERVQDAGWGAGLGGILGGAGGAVASKLATNASKAAVPTVDELKAQAGALYDKADASGVTFGKAEVKQVADDIAAKVLSEGIDPTLHPRATAALKRLTDASATGMTVKDAQTMRRVIAAAAKDPMNPDEQRIAKIMLDKFDDTVSAKAPDLSEARSLYRTAKKGELIETAIELAGSRAGQFSGSGFENALRTEFRSLQNKIIKGQLKGLSQEEIDAIGKVANGGNIENALRFVGKFAPTGVVPTMGLAMLADQLTLGGLGSLGLAGAGIAGRAGATAMTKNNALSAALLARSGGAMPPKALSPKQQAIVRMLTSGGANEGGQIPFEVPARNAATAY